MSERSIFLAAIDIADPAHRANYLDQACGDDAKLRRHIEDLIAAEAKLGTFLNRPHSDSERTDDFAPVVERPGTQIGPYKLMEQIGEGGFGLVFVAEQQQPVRRKVALKVIKPGMDTREVIARFEAERQALALMDHPHIARVLDAGTTEAGRPYFVMELVRGVPITEYCDANQFTPQQRLELFVDVCHAVQHAHQKGVIHRDLKPNNILVAPHDGVPVVKVIDFGVAKALGQQLTAKTIYTRFAQMIGTPLYMSPEQAEINALDVDTRSDVYSLGVLLYELLTGTTPFDKERLLSAGFDEIRRIIREEEPARPSTRVSTLGASLCVISSHRGTDPQKLGQLLRGDLDVIVMKALEKERGRRYDTPNTLADDIQRYLQNEAIAARPASSAYRLKKFIQRNRVAVAAISAIAAVLVLGAGVSTWLAVRESQAKHLATTSLVETEQQRKLALTAKEEAEHERDKAKAINAELQMQKEQQRRMLYVAQMNLVRKAWDSNHIDRVRELLNAVRPQPGEADLRGFEWRYWLRMLHGEERVLQLPIEAKEVRPVTISNAPPALRSRIKGVVSAAFSPDGQYVATLVGFSVTVWDTATGKQLFEKTVDPSIVVGLSSSANVVIGFVNSQRIGILYNRLPRFVDPSQSAGSSQLRVFNINSGEETLARSAEYVANGNETFVFSRDGSRFATPLAEPFVQVCSTETGAEIARIAIPSREGVDRMLEYLALSPNGKRLAVKPSIHLPSRSSGTAVFGITIFELGTDNRVTTPPVTARQLSFDAKGKYLAALYPGGSDRTPGHITVFNSITGNELRSLDVNNASEVAGARTPNRELICFSPDANWLASTVNAPSGIEALQVWNPISGEALPKTQGHSMAPVAIGFNADGSQLASIHNDGKLYFWPLPSKSEMPSSPTETMLMPEGFNAALTRIRTVTSPDGRWMVSGSGNLISDLPGAPPTDFAAGALGREFLLKDKTDKVADRVLTLADHTQAPRFSPNSAYLLAIGIDQHGELSQAGQLKIWEVRSGREVVSLRMPAVETRTPSGRGFGSIPSQGNPRSFRGPTGESALVRSLPISRAIAFSADSQRVAVALPELSGSERNPKQIIHAWELPSGKQFLPAAEGTRRSEFACNQLEFSQNGEVLIGKPNPSTFGRNETIIAASLRQETGSPTQRFAANRSNLQVWSAMSGDLLFEDQLVSLAHSNAAGSRIVALTKASDNDNEPVRALVVWDTHMGQELWRMPLVAGRNYQVLVISPDGCRIAIASGDDVAIYNADTGEELFTLKGHAGDIRSVTFNADHSRIASSTGLVRLPRDFSFGNTNEDPETKVWDGATGQELLSLTRVITGPIARAFGDAELQFKPDKLLTGAGHEWDASGLPMSVEAQELADWLTSPDSDDRFQTLDELAARLKSDDTISDETRSLALQLVRQKRSPAIAYKQISAVLYRSAAPREQYERTLAIIREASDQTAIDFRHLHLEALAHYRLGDFSAAALAATRAMQDAAAKKCSPLAEDLTILAMSQQQLGQTEMARQTLDRARVLASIDEARWQQLVKEAVQKLSIPPADAAPDRWIGHKIMPRLNQRATDETGRTASGYSLPFMITRVEGNRLWFGKNAIDRSQVVPLEDATGYYSNAFEIEPTVAAMGHRGIAWRALGEPEKAIEDYSAAIRLGAEHATSYANRGRVYGYDTGEYEKAIADFDDAIILKPNDAHTHENRGEILWRMGRWEESLQNLNEAIRLDPNCREAYGTRANVYSAIGETEKMRRDLDEGVRRNPDDPVAWDKRAWFLATSPNAEHRDGQQAIVAATKACELTFWNEPPLLDTLAAAHAEVGNFAEAVKWAEKAVALAAKLKRAEFESRLQLYREGKPFHETAKAALPSKTPETSNEQE